MKYKVAFNFLKGKFRTFKEMEDFNDPFRLPSSKIEILYRIIKETKWLKQKHVIETIFIDE